MSPLFTAIVVILALLAVMGIVVGVANDAVNFLNSALGSKVAPRRVILWVAAAGILVGTLTSSGMMEVARSGVFYPGQFSFQEIMMLFLGMMLGNVLLLDLYNTLGLPTSTTVSMVFGLLGAAVAAALFRIAGDPGTSLQDLSQFINTGKAMVIIAAILLSVALAFVAGTLFMYISRLIFSFRYAAVFRRWGAVWCGISLAGILYFALFKGLKSSGLIPTSVSAYVGDHVLVTLLAFWAAASLLLYIFQRMRLNIMRITILSGTFSLALAFAGNDLVNFIGVPLAGYDAWRIAGETGSETMMMGALEAPARANFLLLGVSGLIMVLTLFFSKKSQHVTETELSLASQHEGDERFGSTLIPARVQKAIDRRFEPLPAEERSSAPYDMVRAVVNLTAASILIAIATSYKLPLSTTYVVFMVAMGSSLADRSWGRESAVYRITGVMAVISGWFITALGGFLIALAVTALLLWGGWIAVAALTALCAWLLVRSHLKTPGLKEEAEKALLPLETAETRLQGEPQGAQGDGSRLEPPFRGGPHPQIQRHADAAPPATVRHRHGALLRAGHGLPLGGDQGPDPHHAPGIRTHRQQPRGHVEGADRRPDARDARQALRHDRRGDQEPAAAHQRRPVGQHPRRGALPHDPQRDEDDDAPVAQPAQIAAIFSGGQKIMPIRHRADNPPKPSFEKESFKKRRVTKMQRVRHFSETTDPYLCTVKTGEPDSQVGFRLHK